VGRPGADRLAHDGHYSAAGEGDLPHIDDERQDSQHESLGDLQEAAEQVRGGAGLGGQEY